MVLDLVREVALFDAFVELDLQFARETREKGCPFCGGRLHSAAYSRKARGGPEGLPDEYLTRMSLCCATCRRRTLPPSCLFMGRRVYLFAVIIASCTLRQQRPPEATFDKLTAAPGVSRRAVNAWLDWFATVFPKSRARQKLQGLVDASVLPERYAH